MPADYGRIHRLLRILTLIQADGTWTAQRLAESQALYREGRHDLAFIAGWISWNALYCRWDDDGHAERDFAGMRTCLGDLLQMDREGFIAAWVYRDRADITAVLTDPFLSHHFWREIGRDDGDVELSHHVDPTLPGRPIEQRKWARLIEQLFGRLYVLATQITRRRPMHQRLADRLARTPECPADRPHAQAVHKMFTAN